MLFATPWSYHFPPRSLAPVPSNALCQTSAAFDEGGARGLLLNHLTVDERGTLLFDSQGGSVEYNKEDAPIPDEAFGTLFGQHLLLL